MSSMLKNLRINRAVCTAALVATLSALAVPSSAQMQDSNLLARQPSEINQAIDRWEALQSKQQFAFADYAGFLIAYPDFPRGSILRVKAENRLAVDAPRSADLVRYFEAHSPLTNAGRARFALALAGAQRPEAFEVARNAWRGGQMSEPAEAYIVGLFGAQFSAEDHAARMDALLWQERTDEAARHMINISPDARPMAMARLALVRGALPSEAGLETPSNAMRDAGYVFNLVNHYRKTRQTQAAISLLANRPQFDAPALNPEEFIGDMLAIAKAAGATSAVRIASRTDDLFAPGTDVSQGSFTLRDRYTDLMWLGGTKALWSLGDGAAAAPLFERYGHGARSPLTKSKGYYWAGRAARQAGMREEASRLFEAAAQWPDYYYGQLALGALSRPMPQFAQLPQADVNGSTRTAYEERALSKAILAIASKRRDWRTERRFFQAVGDAAQNGEEMLLAHDLATRAGLPEMAVVLGMKAGERFQGLERVGYPRYPTPIVNDWTMVHAIGRQESEFDRTRVSHAGARGIMQLLRSTAREEAGILGIQYLSANLLTDPQYNIRLGDAHFARRMDLYGGAYPLAIASYNAGPGRVRQWLRLNGDPRKGEIDWPTWIERIPANFETRYYVMRVIGNAVTYSHMYPDNAGLPRTVDDFLP